MQIIIVRKDWGKDSSFRIDNISISLIERAIRDNKNTFNADDYKYIFLHINNEESQFFIRGLSEANKGKLILFSAGGNPQYDWSSGYPFMGGMGNWPAFVELNWNAITAVMSLQEIIEKLKPKRKEHLIALAILCQSYLAAHGLLDSLKGKGIKIDSDKVKLTESPDWWKPALGDDNGAELKKELLIFGKTDEEANKLIQDIKGENVETVYETLRGILAGKQ